MSKRQLLRESWALDFKIEESERKGSSRRLRGLFHLAEVKNANKRIYPLEELKREIERLQPLVSERRILGELGHPDYTTINLANSSHVITELRMEDNKVFGELEILNTPMGKVLDALVEAKVKLGISSRGLGGLREDDGTYYVYDLELITWDVVDNPSTPSAWLNESQSKELQKSYFEVLHDVFSRARSR